MKKCYKCNELKEIIYFSVDSTKKDGLDSSCKSCRKKYREDNKNILSEKRKIYVEKNKDKIKEYFIHNKDRIDEYQKEYKSMNSDAIKKYQKEYYNSNIEENREYRRNDQRNNKVERNKREKLRRDFDDLYRLRCMVRSCLKNSIKRGGYGKNSKTIDILGCSFDELKLYIESKFEDWMNWNNHGLYNGELNYGWDIDHIIPISSAKTEEDVIKLNHYMNLQPLCGYLNRYIKRDN
jgi:hypothetical protein